MGASYWCSWEWCLVDLVSEIGLKGQAHPVYIGKTKTNNAL